MVRPASDRTPRRRQLLLGAMATLLLAGLTVACMPTTTPAPALPIDIEQLTDAQLSSQLQAEASQVQAAYTDPKILASIPPAQKAAVLQIVSEMGTASGRATLIPQLRTAAFNKTRGLPQRPEQILGGNIGMTAGAPTSIGNIVTPTGTRVSPPTDPLTHAGVSVPLNPPSTAPCNAPDGTGTLVLPATTTGGQLITPQHDVYVQTNGTGTIQNPGPLVAAGVPPIANGGSGIEFRTVNSVQQMHVQVALQDTKFGPGALYPLIDLKPIAGTPADEHRATIVDGHIYCYKNDTAKLRGYFDGWIVVPRTEPGFQVIAEVVENDWYFRFSLTPTNPHYDGTLSPSGPQYFAGADRSTVHVGPTPVTTAAVLKHSVGAFATSTADGSAAGVPNVVTDTNGQPTDDLEQTIRDLVIGTINDKVSGALSSDLVQVYVFTAQASLTQPLKTTVDLRFTTPQDGFSGLDEPAGATGALQASIGVEADTALYTQLLGVPCFGITATIKATVKANVWADSTGDGTGIEPRMQYTRSPDVDFDMPAADWLDPTCILAYGLGPPVAEHEIGSAIDDGIYGTFLPVKTSTCFADVSLFGDDGGLLDPLDGLPSRCKAAEPGSFEKLMEGFDLQSYIPAIPLGSATVQPFITNLDNSWCTSDGAPAGCTSDQDLIGKNGVDVVADATLAQNLSQTLGAGLGGRFPNVFAPSTTTTADELTTSQVDGSLAKAGIGVVVDPRLINMLLRDVTQGSSTTRTTNGILDVPSTPLATGLSVTARPEVAPEVLGIPYTPPGSCSASCDNPPPVSRPLAAVVVPDMRLALTTSPGKTIQFSVDASVNAGAQFDPSTGKLKPSIDSPLVDFQVTSGCEADYTNTYWLSYAECGRGSGGNGGAGSLTSVIDFIVNTLVLPPLTDSIGGVGLPSLSSIVPSIGLDLTNVRFAQRGGFIGVYADLRPAPSLAISISTSGIGSVDDDLRFFPDPGNIAPPWTLKWAVNDTGSGPAPGTPVATVPVPTDSDAVQAPLSSFTTFTDADGDLTKTANASLELDEPTLQIKATKPYIWHPPMPPPKTGCLPGTPAATVAHPAITPGGPVAGGPGTQPSGCVPGGSPTN